MSDKQPGGGVGPFKTLVQFAPPADFAMALTEVLTTELAKTGRFIVLERKAIGDIAAEHDLGASGKANAETAAKTGSIIGAQYLVRCAISEYSYSQTGTNSSFKMIRGLNLGASTLKAQVGIDTRVYDSLTSEDVASTTTHGNASSHSPDVKHSDEK